MPMLRVVAAVLILVVTSSAKPARRSNPSLLFGRGPGQRPVHAVRAALREHFGGDVDAEGNDNGDETAPAARNALLQFIVLFDAAKNAQAMCDAAAALPRASCDFVYASVFDGVAVTVTLPQLDDLLTAHGGTVSLAEASLQVHADLIQSGATWGIDRIDQASGRNSQYIYQNSGPEAGEGAKVFVLDTGIRCSHQDIAGRCIAGYDVINNQVCDIDSCVQGSCAVDVDGHGSHCAGTIAGTTYGVAKAATVVAVKVLGDDGGGTWAGIVAGMDWVRAQKVADPSTTMVVSMSLGGAGQSSASATAIDALWGAGVVTSVAAGNDNSDACNYSPAFVPNAITVGSTTSSDARSSFSNYGSCVDIYGPGSSITSISASSDTGTAVKSGTSMACPHVSGVLALIGARNPNNTPAQTRTALLNAAVNGIISNGATPNIFLQSLPIGAPTLPPSPVPQCTMAPSPVPANFQGAIACGIPEEGDTSTIGSIVGNPAPDHYWTFTVPAGPDAEYTFDACASEFDTWIRIFNGPDPTTSSEVVGCDDCGECSSASRTRLDVTLPPGPYSVVMDGYASSSGFYVMEMQCATTPPPTDPPPPTNPPTAPPTTPPTEPPPPTFPPTSPPTDPCSPCSGLGTNIDCVDHTECCSGECRARGMNSKCTSFEETCFAPTTAAPTPPPAPPTTAPPSTPSECSGMNQNCNNDAECCTSLYCHNNGRCR